MYRELTIYNLFIIHGFEVLVFFAIIDLAQLEMSECGREESCEHIARMDIHYDGAWAGARWSGDGEIGVVTKQNILSHSSCDRMLRRNDGVDVDGTHSTLFNKSPSSNTGQWILTNPLFLGAQTYVTRILRTQKRNVCQLNCGEQIEIECVRERERPAENRNKT